MASLQQSNTIRSFFIVIISFALVLCLSVFNFELFSTVSSYVQSQIPAFLEQANGSANAYVKTACPEPCNCSTTTSAPVKEKIVVQEKIVTVEKVKVVEKVVEKERFQQWYAEGKAWHTPGKFPLCSMDSCFNYSRCEDMDELLIYHYNSPSPPVRYFEGLNKTKWYTPDPDKACLFFVFQDLDSPWRPHPRLLEYWNNGMNHVLITFADLWHQRNPPQDTIENATVLSSALLETTYRPGFDIGIPLPGRAHVPKLQSLKPWERKYLLTFRGTRYVGGSGEGFFRSNESFRNIHNGKDVIVATSCRHPYNDVKRAKNPEVGVWCNEDEAIYDQYNFDDLMNSTFSLAPAGISGSSYRFIEVLSSGAIPVLVVDNHVRPFENLIQWPRCALQFPTTEMERIVRALRGMSKQEMEDRQKYCLWVYNEFLKDDETLLRSVMRSLKVRFFGAFPKLSEISAIYKNTVGDRRRRRLQAALVPSLRRLLL